MVAIARPASIPRFLVRVDALQANIHGARSLLECGSSGGVRFLAHEDDDSKLQVLSECGSSAKAAERAHWTQ